MPRPTPVAEPHGGAEAGGDGAAGDGAAGPRPTVEGPVEGGRGSPWISGTSFDLAEVGYTVSEYFVSGTASSFTSVGALAADGRLTVIEAAASASTSAPWRPWQ